MASKEGPTPEARKAGHEVVDPKIRPMLIATVVLVVLIVGSLGAMAAFFNSLTTSYTRSDEPPSPLSDPNALPPQPLLEPTSRGQLDQILRESQAKIDRYEWIDKDSGLARIPIDRAMDLIVERGLPTVVGADSNQ